MVAVGDLNRSTYFKVWQLTAEHGARKLIVGRPHRVSL